MNVSAVKALRWHCTLAFWACAVCCFEALSGAEAEPKSTSPGTITFRRIFVPAGKESKWPVGEDRYLAVDPEEFERLYQAAREPRDGRLAPPAAQLVTAHYEARLEEDSLVGASARWTFHCSTDATLVELGNCGLAISDIRWNPADQPSPRSADDSLESTGEPLSPRDQDATAGDPPPRQAHEQPDRDATADDVVASATLGTRPAGELVCLLDGPGDLTFDWRLQGQRDSSGSRRFDLILPRTISSSLVIDLPLDVSPTVDPGTVAAERAVAGGLRRWRVDLGSADRTTLRIAPLAVLAERERLTLVRQTLNYDVSPRGLELVAEYDLDVHYQPLWRIDFVVAAGLQLAAARYGETPLDWTMLPRTEAEGTRLAIDLPEPVLGEGRKLRLSARGEVVRGQRWQLPTIRPEGLSWQEGKGTIHIAAPLVATQLFTRKCRQTATSALPTPLLGESIEIQYFDPQAIVEVALDRQPEAIAVSAGVLVELAPHSMNAQLSADLTAVAGEWLELYANVHTPWTVTAIESIPSESLSDWSADDDDPSRLRIRLKETLSPDKKLRLKFKAECLRPTSAAVLRPRDLVPLTFQGVARNNEVVGVQARAGVGFRFEGDAHLRRVDPTRVAAEFEGLFEAPLPGLLFQNDEAAATLEVIPDDQPSRYTADTRIEVSPTTDGVRIIYRIHCRPDADRLSKLWVRFAQDRPEPADWRWESQSGDSLPARKLTAEQCQALGRPVGGDNWEVSLPQPQANPFDIVVERFVPGRGDLAANLASLPDASFEQGRIEILAAPDGDVRVETRLRPLAASGEPERNAGLSRGLFRYEPSIDADPLGPVPLIVKRISDATARPPVIVWSSELSSRYTLTGDALHGALFRIQNDGARQLRIEVPNSIEVQELWVEGARASRHLDGNDLVVPLPDAPRYLTVALLCREANSPTGRQDFVAAPLLRIQSPCVMLGHRWFVELPVGYELTAVSPPAKLAGAQTPSLAARLLGPWSGRHVNRGSGANSTVLNPHLPAANAGLPWTAVPISITGIFQGSTRPAAEITSAAPTTIRGRIEYVPRRDFVVWCCGLMAMALTAWRSMGGRWTLVWVLTVTLIAILAPPSWIPFTGAAWLGAVAGTLGRLLLRRPDASNHPTDSLSKSSSFVSTATPAALTIFFIACLSSGPVARGGENAVPKGRENFRVFIPVDADGKPTAGAYQVPENLLFELRRAARESASTPQGYLWTAAEYTGVLTRGDRDPAVDLARIQATYQLDVLTVPSRIEIPFAREAANLLPGSVKLDGRALPVAASPDERSIVVMINEAGEHRLELGLRPRVVSVGDLRRVDLAIPAVINAVVTLELPENPPAVEVRNALGPPEKFEGGRRLRVPLGGANRLNVEWPEVGVGDDSAMEIQELVWLQVRPGSVAVDVRLKYQLGGRPRTVRIVTDPRLRLLSGGNGVSALQPRIVAASPNAIEFDLVPDASGTATVGASFLLTGTSGVGKLRMPRIEPVAGRVTRRWLALSIDPALEFAEEGTAELSPIPAGDFLAAWGPAEAVPNLAHLVPSNDVAWSLATQPRETRTDGKSDLAIVVGDKRALVRFDAALSTESGYVFQHRLSAPPGFVAERVSVLADNTERLARWSQHNANGMTVFLTGPTNGEHRLQIDGWVPVAENGRLPLPDFQLNEVAEQIANVHLYRRPSVLLTLEGATGLETVEESLYAPGADVMPAIPFAHFRAATEGAASGTLIVAPNRPQIQAIEAVTLSRNAEGWQAEYTCALDAISGILNELVLDVPLEWQAPWVCEPPMTVEAIDVAGASRRRLLITPPGAVSGPYRFSVRARLKNSSGTGLKTPRIELNGAADSRRYLILPNRIGEARIDWDTRGLEQADLPAELGIPESSEVTSYRSLDDRGEAVLEAIGSEARKPTVRLADYNIEWASGESATGMAIFDLDPAGLSACPLTLPPGVELLQVFVDGAPAQLVEVRPGSWEVRLGFDRAPTRIQTLFLLPNPFAGKNSGRARLVAPILGDLSVEQTLWRVRSDSPLTLTPSAGKTVRLLEHALVRLRCVVGLIDVLGVQSQEEPTDDAVRNFRPWARRLRAARLGVEEQLATGQQSEVGDARTELTAIDQEQSRLATRLGATELLQQLNSEPLRADQPGQLWERLATGGDLATACAFDGTQSEIHCELAPLRTGQPRSRWLVAAACLALLAGVLYIPASRKWLSAGAAFVPWIALSVLGALIWLEGVVEPLAWGLLVIASLGGVGKPDAKAPRSRRIRRFRCAVRNCRGFA